MLRTFVRRGEIYDRATFIFAGDADARQDRAIVQDAIARAHGFRAIRGLTDELACSGERFRVAVARKKVPDLKRRIRELVGQRRIKLWIAGRRIKRNGRPARKM